MKTLNSPVEILTRVVGLLALVAVLGTVAALRVSSAGNDGHTVHAEGSGFKAELTGSQEVPPVISATTGKADFKVYVSTGGADIRFELEIEDATGILAAAGVHIHCAPGGQNGPIVVFLAGEAFGGFDGDVKIEAVVTGANILNIACGSTIAQLVQSMKNGDTYVNVHSANNPTGEIRGQIEED